MESGRNSREHIGRRTREERRSFSESLADGTSKFFSSMVAKKNGLFNDLSSKIENTFAPKTDTISNSTGTGSDGSRTPPSPAVPHTPPPRPPPPKRMPSMGSSREKENVITRMASLPAYSTTERQSSFEYTNNKHIEKKEDISMNGMNISFDEPIYTQSSGVNHQEENKDPPNSNQESDSMNNSQPTHPKPAPRSQKPPPRPTRQPSTDRRKSTPIAEVERRDSNKSGDDTTNNEDFTGKPRAPKFTTTKRRSSTVDEMLFDEYIDPEVDKVINTDTPPENLINLDNEDASPVNSETSSQMNFGASVDSSDAEFGGVPVHRSTSAGSEKSWSSNYSVDSQPDDVTLECMEFMKSFVDKVFQISEEISQTEKAKFGELCQHFPGRLWFSRYVNSQRVHNKRVSESVFFRLMQYFAVCLFECNEAEDFSPAKTLMNMCFTFYHESPTPRGETEKVFLYKYMQDQPIWQSLRFWNAAFFDAVQCERSRRPMPTNSAGNEIMSDDKNFQENITFGQLGTFAYNMRAFGLSKELCFEFLRKQSTIANLRKDQVKLLKDNLDKVKET